MERFKEDPAAEARNDFERALVRHAAKLTREPSAVDEADIAALRAAGFGDRAILDLTLVIAYFNFVTRLASGLGVPLEK